MTEALLTARATIKTAIEAKTVELMAEVIKRVKGGIADEVLDNCDNPLNERELVEAIVQQLAGYDFEGELNLVSCEVATA